MKLFIPSNPSVQPRNTCIKLGVKNTDTSIQSRQKGRTTQLPFTNTPEVFNVKGTFFKIGQKKANELGIYDMTGNVSEWIGDAKYEYTEEALTDPLFLTIPQRECEKVCRGGSGSDYYKWIPLTVRNNFNATFGHITAGCRVVLYP